MKIWPLAALLLSTLVAVFYVFFFDSGASSNDFDIEAAFVGGVCDGEAVLVQNETTVLAKPEGGLKAILPALSPLYLCGEADGYITIIFPRPGTPANCSTSTSDACLMGVVATPLKTITLG